MSNVLMTILLKEQIHMQQLDTHGSPEAEATAKKGLAVC
jgi:hypothetical protein